MKDQRTSLISLLRFASIELTTVTLPPAETAPTLRLDCLNAFLNILIVPKKKGQNQRNRVGAIAKNKRTAEM